MKNQASSMTTGIYKNNDNEKTTKKNRPTVTFTVRSMLLLKLLLILQLN
ncbi:hypothetical protein XBJ2_400004 [Xenorhabdus bovienii str. Jollieti]|nr:hypothetical protein XBJ2_400004 [Xenorhabdus bovienii str. Jollieti]